MQRSRLFVRSLAFSTVTGLISIGLAPSHAADVARTVSAGAASEAAGLVQAALDAELAGDMSRRGELLAMAVAADPDYAPARWHSGLVNFGGKWRTAEMVQELVTHDARWDEYRELRDSRGAAAADHLELAQWCREHELENEARFHWANVLLADPSNELARDALEIRDVRGRMFTERQIAELERMRDAAEENFKRFKPQMVALCRDAVAADATKRNAALAAIRALTDPAVMEALQFAAAKYSATSAKFALDMQLAMISAFANMPQHDATLRLMNFAVFSRHAEVRKLAAESLKARPQTDYVPLLMSALRAPIDVSVDVIALPDGTVRMTETIEQQGPESDRRHIRSTNFETDGVLHYDRTGPSPADVLGTHLSRAEAIAADSQARAEAANAEAAERNDRIEEALQIATGEDLGDDPEAWWGDWQHYNELSPSPEEDYQVSYEERTSRYRYAQEKPMYPTRQNIQRKGEGAPRDTRLDYTPERQPRRSLGMTRTNELINPEPVGVMRPRRCECFVAGTLVWTQAGPVAIEKIRVGDLVLSQDPHTGEAAYRPVLETTYGPSTGVVDVQIGDETFGVTRGHRFWVNGAGWVMAKHLEPATPVHSLTGLAEVRGVTKRETVDCYNLVVDDFHTYFVGETKILVHDKGCPRPVLASVPGSARARNAAATRRTYAQRSE
jgi:hypothetical protein